MLGIVLSTEDTDQNRRETTLPSRSLHEQINKYRVCYMAVRAVHKRKGREIGN